MTPPLLSIDRVSVARGDRALLNGVTLTLPEGRHTAILGRNGSGKSTLVQLITRQIYPTVGAGGDGLFRDRPNAGNRSSASVLAAVVLARTV